MGFKIEPFGGRRYPSDYAGHDDIRKYLGYAFNNRTGEPSAPKLPRDFTKTVVVPLTDGRTTTLTCLPGNPPRMGNYGRMIKSSKHRCFVVCPDCGATVPAGRTHQHRCKGN